MFSRLEMGRAADSLCTGPSVAVFLRPRPPHSEPNPSMESSETLGELDSRREIVVMPVIASRIKLPAPPAFNRIPQASHFWIVAQDYHGRTLHPVVVTARFTDAAQLGKRGSECGDSVSARGDVISVATAADLRLPSSW